VAVVAVVLGLDEMLFALAPQGGRPTEATCAFAGALVNVLGVNVLGFGVWTLIYAAPRWDALVLGPARGAPYPFTPNMALLSRSRPVWRSFPDHARPRRAALYASYGLLVGFHTLAFSKTMRRLGTVPVAVSKGTQQALPFLLSHILFCHSARDDAHLFRGDPILCMTGASVNGSTHFDGHDALWSHLQKSLSFCICTAGVVLYALLKPTPARAPKASSSTSATATAPLAATELAAYE
jgi:hypothetical protein